MYNYSREDARASLDGMRDNFTWSYDPANYDSINNMTNLTPRGNETATDAAIRAVSTPYKDYWIDPAALGYWFYVAIVFFTVGVVYVKTKNIGNAAITMLLCSMLIIGPESAGALIVPAGIINIFYVMTALSLAAVLMSGLAGRGR